MAKGNPNPNTEGLHPGDKFAKAQKAQAEAWNEHMDVPGILNELTDMGLRFLRGRRKFTTDQQKAWSKMFDKFSDKVLPTAKQEEDTGKTIKIKVKKPDAS